MNGKMILIATVLVALAPPSVAVADENKIVVISGVAQGEVNVHPAIRTMIVFPEKITSAGCADRKNFRCVVPTDLPDSLIIEPKRADTKLQTTVIIATKRSRVSLVIHVTDKSSEADRQIRVEIPDESAAMKARIDRAVTEAVRAERSRMEREIEQRIAARLAERHEVHRSKAVERNGEHVVVRVPSIVFVGSNAYIMLRVQNRSGKSYRLARVQVLQGKTNLAGTVIFSRKIASGTTLGTIADDTEVEVLVAVRGAARLKGKKVALRISEAGGRRAVTVAGVKIP